MNYKIFIELGVKLCIDKWLWVVWFFKMCLFVIDVVDKGYVKIGGVVVKLVKDVWVGDEVEIVIDGIVWYIVVLGVCDVCGFVSVV